MRYYDLIIVGGGASGLAAAITAARNDVKKIGVLERKPTVGRKIAASGNGRCNMANTNAEGYNRCMAFFNSIGVLTRNEDEGRVYPYSEDAKDVVRALQQEANKLCIDLITDTEVLYIEKIDEENVFEAKYRKNENKKEKKEKEYKKNSNVIENTISLEGNDGAECVIRSKACLIACGGKAAPKLGTTGDGFRFAKNFGHSVSRLIPVLTAVELCREPESLGLSGIRQKGLVSLNFRGKTLVEEAGEIQFTSSGLSGICIFNISRYMMIPEGKGLKDGFDDYEIVIDFMPEYNIEEIKEIVKSTDSSLCSLVKEPLAKVIREKTLSEEEPYVQLKAMRFKPKGAKGWDFAQVTRGGVNLEEIDDCFMSRKIDGLFFSGEVLDFDAKCGGYNLTFAWNSGITAGEGIAKYLK